MYEDSAPDPRYLYAKHGKKSVVVDLFHRVAHNALIRDIAVVAVTDDHEDARRISAAMEAAWKQEQEDALAWRRECEAKRQADAAALISGIETLLGADTDQLTEDSRLCGFCHTRPVEVRATGSAVATACGDCWELLP
jgi:uncharacterized ferredoxin-like protein